MRSAAQRVAVPARMAHLDRDARGYPVPVIVLRDSSGRPHFAANDERLRVAALLQDTCSICGGPLGGPRWFVGGLRSAFHPDGAYADPPVHRECMRYAMRVCPYLAAPRYDRRIDAATIDRQEDQVLVMVDHTQIAERPEAFACVLASGSDVLPHGAQVTCRPDRPYLAVEFWRHGRRMRRSEGAALAEHVMGRPLPETQLPRLIVAGGKRATAAGKRS